MSICIRVVDHIFFRLTQHSLRIQRTNVRTKPTQLTIYRIVWFKIQRLCYCCCWRDGAAWRGAVLSNACVSYCVREQRYVCIGETTTTDRRRIDELAYALAVSVCARVCALRTKSIRNTNDENVSERTSSFSFPFFIAYARVASPAELLRFIRHRTAYTAN